MCTGFRHLRSALILLVFLFTSAPGFAAGLSGSLAEDERWSGLVYLDGALRVESGVVLTLAPGTRVIPRSPDARLIVKGKLEAIGAKDAPIRFEAPEGWEGLEFSDSADLSELTHVVFEGGKTLISCSYASVLIQKSVFRNAGTAVALLRVSDSQILYSLFENNGTGIRNEMKSSPRITGNRFVGQKEAAILCASNGRGRIEKNRFENNRNALVINTRYPDAVVGNSFLNNQTAIFCSRTQDSPVIEGNDFEGNGVALKNNFFAYPPVRQNRFTDNETAIHNDRYSSALIEHNLFETNRTAIYNNRKSQAQIGKNIFRRNALALYSNYSSYPLVKNNLFLNNEQAAFLDVHMSADFEGRESSKGIVAKESRSLGKQTLLQAQAQESFEDFVDLSGNWWGGDTSRLEAAGPKTNLDLFFDRQDMPEVEYEGYEGKSYALDRVVYRPWLTEPVSDAGPSVK